MRRSSMITIILLVLIIIGLSVALVVTNLPKKEQVVDNPVEDVLPVEEKTEIPSYLDLNSAIVADMYERLHVDSDMFHYMKKGVMTIEDLTDEDIQTAAYFYDAEKHIQRINSTLTPEVGTLEAKYMDDAVKKMFGDIKYNHTKAYYLNRSSYFLSYSEDDGLYHILSGIGGGSDFGFLSAITEVREYSDRYEVVERGVATLSNNNGTTVYPYYNTMGFSRGNTFTFSSQDELNGTKSVYSSYDLAKKVVSTYYDDATEIVHTFMKNEDGSYYWVKSAITK